MSVVESHCSQSFTARTWANWVWSLLHW
jgi:hypothetical protein